MVIKAENMGDGPGRNGGSIIAQDIQMTRITLLIEDRFRSLPDHGPQFCNHPKGERSGQRGSAPPMDIAIRRQHPVFKEIPKSAGSYATQFEIVGLKLPGFRFVIESKDIVVAKGHMEPIRAAEKRDLRSITPEDRMWLFIELLCRNQRYDAIWVVHGNLHSSQLPPREVYCETAILLQSFEMRAGMLQM